MKPAHSVTLALTLCCAAAPAFAQMAFPGRTQAERQRTARGVVEEAIRQVQAEGGLSEAEKTLLSAQRGGVVVAQTIGGRTVYRALSPEQFNGLINELVATGKLELSQVPVFASVAAQESRKNTEVLRQQARNEFARPFEEARRGDGARRLAEQQRRAQYDAQGLTQAQRDRAEEEFRRAQLREDRDAYNQSTRNDQAQRVANLEREAQQRRERELNEMYDVGARRGRNVEGLIDGEFRDNAEASRRTANGGAAPRPPAQTNPLSAIDQERYAAYKNGDYLIRNRSNGYIQIVRKADLEAELNMLLAKPKNDIASITPLEAAEMRQLAVNDTRQIVADIESRMNAGR